ncbi:hypothetical protein QVA66_03450 [Staphylococcus chromogenes]|nr:hypothetical protein [Staphylococcus chromogenes]
MRYVNQDFSRGEAAFGLFWLSLGALLSVLLEVVYLGTWITLPGGKAMAFPYPIVIALLFNAVLSKTAMLWTRFNAIAAIPLWVWGAGFFGLTFTQALSGDILVGPNPRSLMLLLAGVAGGAWPLMKPRVAQ